MIDNTAYKNSSIGLIPSNWEVKKIKEIGDVSSGGTPDTTKVRYWNGDINWCTPTDITALKNKFLGNTKTKITEEGLKSSSAKILPPFSIIVCTRATIGKAAINTVPMSTNQGFKNIIPKNIDTDFLYYKILSEEKGLIKIANGSTFLEVSKTDFDNFHIAVPPLPEQQKIASILSTWDVAIDNCKAIIEELKIRNKGLTQKLLTGKMRVKGFEKATWSLIPIKKIAKDSSKKNPANKDLVVLSCTKYNGLVPSLEYFGRKIYSDDLTTYKIVSKGQFAYATNHIEEGSIGYQSSYDEALISPMYTVFKTDETVNDNFLFRVLKSTNYIHEYQKRMEGSIDRRGGLRWDEFSKIKVPIPELKEQLEIVEILDKATEELNQYQQKLETLQLQKKGLMQQLLTGKVRVTI